MKISKHKILLSSLLILITITIIVPQNVRYLYHPHIESWQIKNDNIDFIQKGYLVPILKNLNQFESNKVFNYKRYEEELIKKSSDKGVSSENLSKALKNSKRTSKEIPIYIETANYDQKPVYIIIYKAYHGNNLVQLFHLIGFRDNLMNVSMGLYRVVIVDKDSSNVIKSMM